MNKREKLIRLIKIAQERGIVPADALIELGELNTRALIEEIVKIPVLWDAAKLEGLIPADQLPLYTYKERGAVPPPPQKGLILWSDGWLPLPARTTVVQSMGGHGGGGSVGPMGPQGPQGIQGIQGPPGVCTGTSGTGTNYISSGTSTNLSGILMGDGFNVGTAQPNVDYTALVNPSVVGNFVSFSNLTGAQADSGYDAGDFALIGHNHAGVYEPVDATIVRTGDANWIDLTDGGTTTLHTHAGMGSPSILGNGAMQYQTIITGATPFAPVYSGFLLDGTTGGKTVFAVTNTKTLTLTTTDNFNLTVPATGIAALLATANVFTTTQTITPGTDVTPLIINIPATVNAFQVKTGATVLASIESSHGFIGIGAAADPQMGVKINYQTIVAGAGEYWDALRSFWYDTSTASNTHYTTGGRFSVKSNIGAGLTNSGYISGLVMTSYQNGEGTCNAVYGANMQAGSESGTGTINSAYGALISLVKAAGTTIVNGYGLSVVWDAVCSGGQYGISIAASTVASAYKYAIYLGDVTGGSVHNYAISTGTGLNKLGDQLSIVGSADRIQLSVKAYSTQTTNLQTWLLSTGSVAGYIKTSGPLVTWNAGTPTAAMVVLGVGGLGGSLFINTTSYPDGLTASTSYQSGLAIDGVYDGGGLSTINIKALGVNYANAIYKSVLTFSTTAQTTLYERMRMDISGVIINESGDAVTDFRVESDTYDALFVDASNNSIVLMSNAAGKVGLFGHAASSQPAAYTPSNVTTTRTFNANATTLDEIADVLGTLIADIQSLGVVG
jgi:hypothetical protein